MIYQNILRLNYVVMLINVLLNENKLYNTRFNVQSKVNRHIYNEVEREIIQQNNKFYIKKKNDLIYIDENMKKDLDIKKILNTVIFFEKYKSCPLELYIRRETYIKELQNKEQNQDIIDYELLHNLQLQYVTNRSYFI